MEHGEMSLKFPHGRAGRDDRGQLDIAVAADKRYNIIRIMFRQEVSWIGLDVTTAENFIKILEQKVDELKAGGILKDERSATTSGS